MTSPQVVFTMPTLSHGKVTMSSRNRLYISISALLPLLSGCSVAMALSGTPEPNFEAFEVGSNRKQVEIQLGSPIASQQVGRWQEGGHLRI